MKHISRAMQHLHSRGTVQVDNESSLVQRILALDPDPKTACILALDMFLVGIDTVRYHTQSWHYSTVNQDGCCRPNILASWQ